MAKNGLRDSVRGQGRRQVGSLPDQGAQEATELPPPIPTPSYAQLGAEVTQILTTAKEAADSLVADAQREAAALRYSMVRECDDLLKHAVERDERSAALELELRRRIDAVEEAVVAMRSYLGSPSEVGHTSAAETAAPSKVLTEGEADKVRTGREADSPSTLPEVAPGEVSTGPESGTVKAIQRSDLPN